MFFSHFSLTHVPHTNSHYSFESQKLFHGLSPLSWKAIRREHFSPTSKSNYCSSGASLCTTTGWILNNTHTHTQHSWNSACARHLHVVQPLVHGTMQLYAQYGLMCHWIGRLGCPLTSVQLDSRNINKCTFRTNILRPCIKQYKKLWLKSLPLLQRISSRSSKRLKCSFSIFFFYFPFLHACLLLLVSLYEDPWIPNDSWEIFASYSSISVRRQDTSCFI